MLKNLYSLRDNKSKTHKDLFPANNHEEAKRLIHAAALPPSGPTLFAQYPDDFTLFFHGELDCTTGRIFGSSETMPVGDDDKTLIEYLPPHKIATVREILIEFDKSFRDAELAKTSKKKGRKS